MRRFALALLVGILSFSAIGVTRLMIGEACPTFTLAPEDDGNCPPTCVTCGCCAQAAEAEAIIVTDSQDVPIPNFAAILPRFTDPSPRDILHVPKALSV